VIFLRAGIGVRHHALILFCFEMGNHVLSLGDNNGLIR
jgi:hypothetical protein